MVTAIVLLDVDRDQINPVAEQLADLPGVTEVYSVAGRYDLAAIIRRHSRWESGSGTASEAAVSKRPLNIGYWTLDLRQSLTAVIWDFDGTLVDTRRRNYNVVRRILAEVAGRRLEGIAALRSPDVYDRVNRSYANWRDLYTREFGFSEEDADRVGRMWTRY